MPSTVLARRITALETCRVLYECRELDDSLQPVGKESVLGLDLVEENEQEDGIADSLEPRPGTTKRRQYYYKRVSQRCSSSKTLTVLCWSCSPIYDELTEVCSLFINHRYRKDIDLCEPLVCNPYHSAGYDSTISWYFEML